MADSSTRKAEIDIGNLPSPQVLTEPSNSDAPAPGSTTNGEKERFAPQRSENQTGSIPSLRSPQAARYTTLVAITLTSGRTLQVEVWDDYQNVVTQTTSARGGSHWSWAGTDPRNGERLARIVKIEDVQDIVIRPLNLVTPSATA